MALIWSKREGYQVAELANGWRLLKSTDEVLKMVRWQASDQRWVTPYSYGGFDIVASGATLDRLFAGGRPVMRIETAIRVAADDLW